MTLSPDQFNIPGLLAGEFSQADIKRRNAAFALQRAQRHIERPCVGAGGQRPCHGKHCDHGQAVDADIRFAATLTEEADREDS